MLINKLETKIKLSLLVSVCTVIGCVAIVVLVLNFSYRTVSNERKKIYVLTESGIPILVEQTGIEVNLEAEARAHVELFHRYFFTLPPDDEFIERNMKKAMYLVDESGLRQYNNLRERGFFNNILASSANISIVTDSIAVDIPNMSFVYYGTQRIERDTSILKRQLITEGRLRSVPRTDNNGNGLLIVDWKTVLNKDIEYKPKRNF